MSPPLFDYFRTPKKDASMAAKNRLSEDDRNRLAKLERTVEAGVHAVLAMIDAGKALRDIFDGQLYRESQGGSWSKYVTHRFGITARRASQMMSFAGVSEVLESVSEESGPAVPLLSERAARPIANMPAEEAKEVILQAASMDGGVTSANVAKAASSRRPARRPGVPRPSRFRVPGAVVEVALNKAAIKAGINVVSALEAALDQARQAERREAA
jgi:hypothetical protein